MLRIFWPNAESSCPTLARYNSCNLRGTTSSNVAVDPPDRILCRGSDWPQDTEPWRCHRSIALARGQWAAADNIVNWRERTRHLKFERGSECVSDSKSEVTSPIALDGLHWERFYLTLFSDATESLGLGGQRSSHRPQHSNFIREEISWTCDCLPLNICSCCCVAILRKL